MNATQAENLRILIRHMESSVKRTLEMNCVSMCGTPACAIGEAAVIPALQAQGLGLTDKIHTIYLWWNGRESCLADAAIALFGIDKGGDDAINRLFGSHYYNAWGRENVTPQEWATEARKVLSENGYSMDDGFAAFKANLELLRYEPVIEPVVL